MSMDKYWLAIDCFWGHLAVLYGHDECDNW